LYYHENFRFFPFWSAVVALRSTPGVKSNDRAE